MATRKRRRRWAQSSYVTAAERRAKSQKAISRLQRNGAAASPIVISGRDLAHSFWGLQWCAQLESFSDFENRLPRGRTYVRNGSVCHLEICKGGIKALVTGTRSEPYDVAINIDPLPADRWAAVRKLCAGRIGSLLEILQGQLSDHVMGVVADPRKGLLPKRDEIEFSCSCPDWALMCKHVAAALYGVGSRLDDHPEHLFVLRGVDAAELVAASAAHLEGDADGIARLPDAALGDIFGIEMEDAPGGAGR